MRQFRTIPSWVCCDVVVSYAYCPHCGTKKPEEPSIEDNIIGDILLYVEQLKQRNQNEP